MLIRVAIFAALGGFLYGYDLGLIGGAMLSIQDEIPGVTEAAVELIVAGAKIGAFFGTFLGGGLMLYYGRRTTIAMDSVFFMLGPIIMASASGVSGLVAGRLLIGLGIGISSVVVPAYLGELAPAKVRGRIVEVYEVVLCVGMLAAVLADAALSHAPNNWRWMVGLPVIPGMILSAAMWMLPESPRWLVVDGRLDEALAVIHVMYTNDRLPSGSQESTAEVEHELLELWSSVEKDKEAARERAIAARIARAARKAQAPADKQLRKQAGRGEEWQPLQLQEVQSQQSDRLLAAASSALHSAGDIPDRPPGLQRGDGKAPPSPFVEVAVHAVHSEGQPENGLRQTKSDGVQLDHPPGLLDGPDGGSPSMSRALHRQLSDPTSPLYRSLSEIPTGLRPIRTTSFSTDGEGTSPATAVARNDPHKSLRNAASVPRRRTAGTEQVSTAGFWITQKGVILDTWRILWGPESRAVRLALWIAVIDQAMASTAIVNYAPALIQQTSLASNADATLWTGFVTGAKIIGSVACMFLVDSAGRRPLLIWGSALCGLSLLALGVADHLHSAHLMVAAMCAFIMAFSASYAGIFWVLLSELFSMTAKAPAAAAATAALFIAGALPDLLYLTLHNWMGPASFVVFAGVAFFGCGYCHLHLPETKGRTLAEVQALLAKKGTAATSAADHAVSEASSLAAASGLGSGHEQMMRPNGEAAPSAAIGGRALPQSVAADEGNAMEQGQAQRWGPGRLMRQWAGYSRFQSS